MANFKIPDKPLTSEEVDQRMYEMMIERTRQRREYLCRYKDHILNLTTQDMAKRCTKYVECKDDFDKCMDEQKVYKAQNVAELKTLDCSNHEITFPQQWTIKR